MRVTGKNYTIEKAQSGYDVYKTNTPNIKVNFKDNDKALEFIKWSENKMNKNTCIENPPSIISEWIIDMYDPGGNKFQTLNITANASKAKKTAQKLAKKFKVDLTGPIINEKMAKTVTYGARKVKKKNSTIRINPKKKKNSTIQLNPRKPFPSKGRKEKLSFWIVELYNKKGLLFQKLPGAGTKSEAECQAKALVGKVIYGQAIKRVILCGPYKKPKMI